MTVKEIAQRLRDQGHTVTLYQRKDRGYLITSINGVKYRGAQGNTVARAMVGVSISTRRATQLKSITPKAQTEKAKLRRKGYPKKTALSEALKKELRSTQRSWRKTQAKGRITTAKVRYILENEGEAAAYEALAKAKAYSRGYAYDKNIEALAQRIESLIKGYPKLASELQSLANDIRTMIGTNTFKEEWIAEINYEFYTAEYSADDQVMRTAISHVRKLINK